MVSSVHECGGGRRGRRKGRRRIRTGCREVEEQIDGVRTDACVTFRLGESRSGELSSLTGRLAIPPLRLFQVRRRADADLGEVAHGELGLGEAGLGSPSGPQVRFGVALLQDALGPGEVPAAQGELAVVFGLHRGAAVPGDALARVDREACETVLVRAAEPELRELVAQFRGGEQEPRGRGHVLRDVLGGVAARVEERLSGPR